MQKYVQGIGWSCPFFIVFFVFSVAPATASFPSLDTPWAGPARDVEAQSQYRGVIGAKGMVSSDDRDASEWGVEIMRRGGNAVDAAVATAFYMSVTRPQYASLGGGGFLVYCPPPAGGKALPCTTIDYREMAPKAASRDMYVVNGKVDDALSKDGALASGVPGVPAGLLLAQAKFGKLSRAVVLSKPIQVAREGFRFTGRMESLAAMRWEAMNREGKRLLGCFKKLEKAGGDTLQPCAPGAMIKQPELAHVLTEISQKGADGFYKGWVAAKIAAGLKTAGGILTAEDLATYEPKFREPIVARVAGGAYEVVSMGPPSSGGSILAMSMKYAELADASGEFDEGPHSARALHAITHALTLAFADRAGHFGDPDQVHVPLAGLLNPDYLEKRWKSTFQRGHANIPPGPGSPTALRDSGSDAQGVTSFADLFPSPASGRSTGMETTHFSVIDRNGGAVALTTTVNDNYGSAFVPPGTGIFMNNEMDDFAVQPGVPNMYGLVGSEANAVASRKRPLSSMSPTIVRDLSGNARIAIGAQGGPKIASSTFIALLHRLRFGMSIADSVISPRVHHQWKPASVAVEGIGFSAEVRAALVKMGYELKNAAANARMHAVERFPATGRTWGVADPRTEGGVATE